MTPDWWRGTRNVDVESNEKVDELARKKESIPLVGTEAICGLGFVVIKK